MNSPRRTRGAHVSFRLPQAAIDRADAIAALLTQTTYFTYTRAAVLEGLIRGGLDILEGSADPATILRRLGVNERERRGRRASRRGAPRARS